MESWRKQSCRRACFELSVISLLVLRLCLGCAIRGLCVESGMEKGYISLSVRLGLMMSGSSVSTEWAPMRR
jgi:hypothetical protein